MIPTVFPLETPVPASVRDDCRELISLHEREDFHVRALAV